MKDRASDEQKAESSKLKAVMERHKTLIPKIQETLVKTECYWKCYSYGDDLIPIFEFIDDLRNRLRFFSKSILFFHFCCQVCQGTLICQQRAD